jgi:hypothetical protein
MESEYWCIDVGCIMLISTFIVLAVGGVKKVTD